MSGEIVSPLHYQSLKIAVALRIFMTFARTVVSPKWLRVDQRKSSGWRDALRMHQT